MKGFNDYEIKGDYTIIFLRGKHSDKFPTAIVDTKNLEKLISANLSWSPHLEIDKKFYYVFATEYLGIIDGKPKNKSHTLHRFIMGEQNSNVSIDHINHDNFDNRECNLRKSNYSKNGKNRKSKNSNNTSGYRNVSLIKGKWTVQLQVNGKNKILGKFENLKDAGEYAELMRQKYYKEFAGND